MAMEKRCHVKTWAEFGFTGLTCAPRVRFGGETDVLISTGDDEVYVYSSKERRFTAVLQFPDPVTDLLVESHDKQLLYVACSNGVYCFGLKSLLSSSQDDRSSCPAELKISSKSLIVGEKDVLSLLLVGSTLLTLSLRDTTWRLTLYRSSKQSACSSYETITSFSLPLASGVLHTDGTTWTRRKPVLICVHSSDATPPSASTSPSELTLSSSHFHLQPVLFKLLFGIDATLAKSPVVLCGLPDGCLYILPLRLPASQLRVLHSLEQPVVFVGTCSAEETGAHGLVAVGEMGRVVLIRAKREGPDKEECSAGFIESCVPGPVLCGCTHKNSLYYSTGSDLLRLDLSVGSLIKEDQEKDVEESRKADYFLHSPVSLNVCRVITFAEPSCNVAGEVELLGLSVRGQLQRITLPASREDAGSLQALSTQVDRGVRELLSAIGDVCERASILKTAIKSKNQMLKHLNQVLNICFLLTTSPQREDHLHISEKPIRCHAVTEWSRLLQQDSLKLTCVLENSSPYAFEQGWTLSVTVFPLSRPPSEGGENTSRNFSFPFHSVHPGETLEVALPLATAGDASFPMTVSCLLIFTFSSLLDEDAASLPNLQRSFTLPLNTLTVDWLHALQVSSGPVTHKKAASQCRDSTVDAVQALLSLRQIRGSGRGEGGKAALRPEPEQFSASVRLSSDLIRNTLTSDPQGGESAHQHVCLSLLQWLLSEGCGEVRAGRQRDKISSSAVHAQCPDGHSVKLTAKEVGSGEGGAGSLPTVVVHIESSSIAAVCGLHHAVLRRVQALLQKAPENAAATSVQSLGLRSALQRAEHLLQQIQQSRVSGAFAASTGQMTRSLLAVYRELRENPLVIL